VIRFTAAALAAVTIAMAVGCSTAGQNSTAADGQRSATGPASSAHAAPVVARRLTMAQARAAYIRIARPFNAAVAAVNRDVADGAPWSRFRADTLAVVRADRAWARHMRAERWPARVQRYVAAMLRSDIPAEIRCDRAMAAAGRMQAATTVFNTRPDCKDRTANEDKIRRILHLPPVT
jgi:hypothetical protein